MIDVVHLLQLSEIRKDHARRASFHVVERLESESSRDGRVLADWAVERLAAHRCEMGLYVAESGVVAEDGEDEYDLDVWIAWDGVGVLSTCDRAGTPRPVPALDRP